MALSGSCLCGGVRYQIDRLDGPISHCHCHSCRKAHASAFVATAAVERAHFRWIAGEELVRGFESSPGKQRHFCSGCGTHLVAERVGQTHVILRVATLDDDPAVRPSFHIWTAHDVPWLAEAEEAPRYREWQPGR